MGFLLGVVAETYLKAFDPGACVACVGAETLRMERVEDCVDLSGCWAAFFLFALGYGVVGLYVQRLNMCQ